jgi:hypothetical protein
LSARWFLVSLLTLALLHPGRAAPASPRAFRQAATTWDGVVLSLRVTGSSFPKNALVRATVTLTNRSKRTRRALSGSCEYAYGTLSAKLLLESGAQAPLPEALAPPQSCGPPPRITSIRPGHHLSRQLLLILSGSIVQGSVLVDPNGAGRMLTVSVHLPLSDEPAPQVALDGSPPTYGTVHSPAPRPWPSLVPKLDGLLLAGHTRSGRKYQPRWRLHRQCWLGSGAR